MKNLLKVLLVLLIPILGVYLLSYPGVWKYRIENILNKKVLKESGWNLSIGILSGHLLQYIESNDIEIRHENGTLLYIPKLNTKINILNSLLGDIHLEELNISDFHFQQSNQKKDSNEPFKLPDLDYDKFPLQIDRLNFDGELKIALIDTTHLVDLAFKSSIYPDQTGLNILIDSLFAKHNDSDYQANINNTKINIYKQKVNLNPINGSVADIFFDGRMEFVQSTDQRLNGNINVNNILIPEKLFNKTPLQIKFSEINSNVKFDTDFSNYSGVVTVKNDLGLNMNGDFNITKMDDRWLAQQIILQSEDARLFIHGDIIDQSRINANLDLNQLDLSKWLTQQKITDISGIATLNTLIDSGSLKNMDIKLTMQESALFNKDTITVNGEFVYENNQINIANPLTIKIGPSSIASIGNINFEKKVVDLELDLHEADVFILNNFWRDSLDSGTISGKIKAIGQYNNPVIDGAITGKNIKYRDLYFSEFDLEGNRKKDIELLGSAKLNFGSGKYKNIEFEEGNVDAIFNSDGIHFNEINLVNGEEYFKGTGLLNKNNVFQVQNIKTFYHDHYFVNTAPFSITYQDKIFSVSPFKAHLDDGVIEGELAYDNLLKGHLKFSNIDSEIYHPFIKEDKLKITGLIFGEITFDDSTDNQNYVFDGSIKNGLLVNKKFNSINVSASYTNHILNIEEFVMSDSSNSNFTLNGFIPFGKTRKTSRIKLSSKFQDTDIRIITQFIPDWYDLTGLVSGELEIDGTGEKMNGTFEATVKDATFDIISLGTVKTKGGYDGDKFNFDSITSDLNDDHLTGYGFFPINLNIHSDNFGDIDGNDSLYIFTEGKTTNLDFITLFFEEVDKATGDYTLSMELSGIWDKIIRNGRLVAKDAAVITPLLDDPIRKLNGSVNILDNQFVIENLQGKMYQKGRRSDKKKDNVFVSGSMDMTSFFEPRLDFKARGRNTYFRSLIYELEGITDFDINITGQDTVLIAGEVVPIDVEMFQELVVSELGILPVEEGTVIIQYKIDYPIRGTLKLTNSQLEAVFIGDVSINQIGDREADYAGELIFEEGKYYYYGDVFTITEGYLTFDNHGFNPYLNISANTTIDNERIEITITGQFDNPILTFTSESGFSQSDILELLTWRKNFNKDASASTKIGKQAPGRALSWFGSQLDRNILEFSGLNQLGILEKVNVRGTSGLILHEEDFELSAPVTRNVAFNYAYRNFDDKSIVPLHSLGLELRLNRYLSLVGIIDNKSNNVHVKYRLRYAY